MTKIELSEAIKSVDMYELACKTNARMDFSETEEDIVANLDAHFKAIGAAGHDPQHEIASFIQKVINRELYDEPDELLDRLFERGTIGEFDDFEATVEPKNTLVAYEAAKGGNVDRSYLDVTSIAPTWKNFQIETDISYADIAKNGWKTVAKLTEYAMATFRNAQFAVVFEAINSMITSGAENYIAISGTMPTQAEADAIALYVNDRGEGDGVIVSLSKYVQAMSKLNGFASDEMKNEVHRTGKLGSYDGVEMYPISGAKKLGDGTPLLQDKRIFGIAGKIGTLNMKGDVKVYQDSNNNTEKFHIMFKDFTFGFAFNDRVLENVCMGVIA